MKFSTAFTFAILGQQAAAFTGGRNRPAYPSQLNQADVATSTEEMSGPTGGPTGGPALDDLQTSSGGQTLDDLKTLALDLNPAIPYYDPLRLATNDFTGQGESATIGFLREAEIKHGRVAMAAFVGYWVQANGVLFNFASTFPNEVGNTPPNQWDELPYDFRLSIILLVAIVEFAGEYKEGSGEKHYMRGGKPGFHQWFPKFPRKDEAKRLGRLKEINNGRLAMLGMFGFVSESTVPGSVPLLTGRIPAYDGNIWNPFEKEFVFSVPEQPVTTPEAIEVVSNAAAPLTTAAVSNEVVEVTSKVVENVVNVATEVATSSAGSELSSMLQDFGSMYK